MPALNSKQAKTAIALFYLLLFAGLILYDEKLGPELEQELARPLPKVMEPGNGWLAVLGIDASAGTDPFLHGQSRMRALEGAVKSGSKIDEALKVFEGSKNGLGFKGKLPGFYGPKDGGILAYARDHAAEAATLVAENRELLARYDRLRSYPRYVESLEYGFHSPVPKFGPLRDLQKTRLLELAGQARQGNTAGALAGLRQDLEFWRFMARNARTIISKLIAFASLNSGMQFAAELAASQPLGPAEMKVVRDILRPFPMQELSMLDPLHGEARSGMEGLAMMRSSDELNAMVYKPNATRNRLYAGSLEQMRLAGMDARRFAEETRKRKEQKAGTIKIGLSFLYNPAGEILAQVGQPAATPRYVERAHNIEGLRRLALLKVAAHTEKIPQEQMQQFLDRHAQNLGDPYTAKPMRWDAKKRSISFADLTGEKPVELVL